MAAVGFAAVAPPGPGLPLAALSRLPSERPCLRRHAGAGTTLAGDVCRAITYCCVGIPIPRGNTLQSLDPFLRVIGSRSFASAAPAQCAGHLYPHLDLLFFTEVKVSYVYRQNCSACYTILTSLSAIRFLRPVSARSDLSENSENSGLSELLCEWRAAAARGFRFGSW